MTGGVAVDDWRDRFRAPIVRYAVTASRRPDRGVVLTDRDGPIEAYAWDVTAGTLRQLSGQGTATLVVAISPDGERVLHLADETGAEHGHIVATPFDAGPAASAVDLTPDLPHYAALGPGALAATGDGFVAGATVDGEPHLVVADAGGARIVPFDGYPVDVVVTGDTIAVTRPMAGRGMTMEVVLLDRSTLDERDRVPEARVTATLGPDLGLAVVRDGWDRPALLRDGEVVALEVDLPGEVVPLAAAAGAVLLSVSHRAVDGLVVLGADGAVRRLALPPGILPAENAVGFDGDRAMVVWAGAQVPGVIVEVDEDGHRPVLAVGDPLPGAAWEEFTFESTEDVEVQGWLLRPRGDGPHPTILSGHGGPTAVNGPGFSPIAQAWVDHGWAFATINYRGSTGFGEEFREALTGRIGGPELEDLVAGHDWLLAQGIADPELVVLNGYSYGGYLTGMLLGTHPERWAGGIAGAPVTDWVELYEDSPATRGYARALFGGGPQERGDAMAAASPSAYVDEVVAPVFVSAPVDDARTPIGPVRRYVERLRERGVPVELHELRGGHAGVGKEQWIDMVERWLDTAEGLRHGR